MVDDYVEEHPIIDAIRQYICEEFDRIYIKRCKLFLDGDSYSIYFELNNMERPIMLGGQYESDADFIAYIEKELKARKFHFTKYFSGYEVDKPIETVYGYHTPEFQAEQERIKKILRNEYYQ